MHLLRKSEELPKVFLPIFLKDLEGGDNEKIMFYMFSRGSANETKNHLIYGTLVKYFESEKSTALISKIENLVHELNKIIKTLENKGGKQ